MEVIKKNGRVVGFSMTKAEYLQHEGHYNGACLDCGQISFGGVEPDGREYECELCGEMVVYGIPELLVMGKVQID